MFELLEIYRNLKFTERIFPIVLRDAKIFEPMERLDYLSYWQQQKDKLDQAIQQHGSDAITVIGDDYKTYKKIFDHFGEITNILKDVNSLTPGMHQQSGYQELIEAVKARMQEDEQNPSEQQGGNTIKNNTTNIQGSGNINIQDSQGGNININTGGQDKE